MSVSTRPVLFTDEDLYNRVRTWVEPQSNGCLLWTGATTQGGYGYTNVPKRVRDQSPLPFKAQEYAHRIAFAMQHGRLPWPKMHLDHLCRNRSCVNPDHLEEVSPRENLRRGDAPTWVAHRTGYCGRGHKLVAGKRCQRCHSAKKREREYAKRRAEFLANHPWCLRCGGRATEIHHRAGRIAGRLLDDTTWASACHDCHVYITAHPAEAIERGWSLRRVGTEVPWQDAVNPL